ncbi:hypothetical protein BH11MYX4_BH11MYX4_02310 [soil metagenome]
MKDSEDTMTPASEQPAELFEGIDGDALLVLALSEDVRAALVKANRIARLRAWASIGGGR